jgi:hypothetical protein
VSSRKTILDRPGEVPSVIVAALIVWLLAVFVPLASITPDLPSTLPSLSVSDDAILALHARIRAANGAADLDESFTALARAGAARDLPSLGRLQREFAARVLDTVGDDPTARAALRDSHLRRFLTALERGSADPVVAIAARHRLVGAGATPGITRATLIAWFDYRWEMLAAREVLRDQPLPLERMLGRLPPAEGRAMVAWVLRADCDALLGTAPDAPPGAEQLLQCAALQREFVALAARLESGYPADEARAALDARLAHSLASLAARASEAGVRSQLEQASRDVFARAHGQYTLLAERQPSRRLQRYLLATAHGMGQ